MAEQPMLDLQVRSLPCERGDDIIHQQEQSPAYRVLAEEGLIVNTHRLRSIADLDVVEPNASVTENCCWRLAAYIFGLIIGGIIYDILYTQFSVKAGHVRPGYHSNGTFFFYAPGVHRVTSIFITLGEAVPLTKELIEHGNTAIATIPQGYLGLAFDRGQPILLAPGMHQWTSETLKMQANFIDLSTNVISIGPFTLVTVDEGYAAITQDNGKQKILNGGSSNMLTHKNWKFEKFMSLKLHTDDIGPFTATTADNVVLQTMATASWRVVNAELAARMAADTMQEGARRVEDGSGSTPALRSDVLKQCIASLAQAVGAVRYADDVTIAASDKVGAVPASIRSSYNPTKVLLQDEHGISQIFSLQQMSRAVSHANEICHQYGVSVVAINVISAVPADKKVEEALSAGAVASAAAQQAEIAAKGNAKARVITAQAQAEAVRINALANADSDRTVAEGKKDAAKRLEMTTIAVDLMKLEKAAQAVGDKSSFFFGVAPDEMSALLSNPNLTRR